MGQVSINRPGTMACLIAAVSSFMILALPAAHAESARVASPFRFYTTVNGLSQASVIDITQDSAGYLWVATQRGVNRFNGRDFEHFTIADGLPANFASALATGKADEIWVGNRQGSVALIRGERVVMVVEPPMQNAGTVNSLIVGDHHVFVATENAGLLKFDTNEIKPVMVSVSETAGRAVDLSIQGDHVWFVLDTALYSVPIESSDLPVLQHDNVTRHFAYVEGRHWITDDANRLAVVDKHNVQLLDYENSTGRLRAATFDQSGRLWLAGVDHLESYDVFDSGQQVTLSRIRRHEEIRDVATLLVDADNRLWAGTSQSLLRFLGYRFSHYRITSSQQTAAVWDITQDDDGAFYFGTDTEVAMMSSDGTITRINDEANIPVGPTRALISDRNNTLWAGVRGFGLYKYNASTRVATLVPRTEGMEILDLALEAPGKVWISTIDRGLFSFSDDSGHLMHHPVPDNTSVYTMDFAPDGSLWFGADNHGLVRLARATDGRYSMRSYGQTAGFNTLSFNHIRAMSNDELWVGTEDGGLFHFIDNKATNIGPSTPLSDQTVYLIEPLADGTIVAGGEQGLYQIARQPVRSVGYGPAAGFFGQETNVHSTYWDREGYLWIGTTDGATRVDTRIPMSAESYVTPRIVAVKTRQGGVLGPSGASVGWRDGSITIEFASVSLLDPKSIEYSYRLAGQDDHWGEATRNQIVSYSALSPGDYQFDVRSRLAGGPWSKRATSYSFDLQAPVWRQTWFVLCVLSSLFALLALFIRLRMQRMQKLTQHLREQVAERTRSIERAKEKLSNQNEQLSKEIHERQKADRARADIEMRFRHAFENTPIGMGLITAQGQFLEANESLREMFHLQSDAALSDTLIQSLIEQDSRHIFENLLALLRSGTKEDAQAECTCIPLPGTILQTVISLSAVSGDEDDGSYYVLQVQDVTEARKLTDQLEYQANYDELTGLANRRSFESSLKEAVDQAKTQEYPAYLLFMDLDRFKTVNDTAGHNAGDELLRLVADIMRKAVRADDVIGRLGGDEFGMILWRCPPGVVQKVAESIRVAIEQFQFIWGEEKFRIGISIGAVPITEDQSDLEELQQLADAACYGAKSGGRNRVNVVTNSDASLLKQRGEGRWVQRLHDAMEHGHFALFGQIIRPIVRGPENGAPPRDRIEILLRMRDPANKKLIPPGAFLPIAERYDLSTKVDEWVVKTLLDMLHAFHACGAIDSQYWVNLSGASIGDQRFADFLCSAIKATSLPPGTVNFEITETAVIRNLDAARELIVRLKAMGCKFALDDFGSGLSSFGYLKELPVDFIKIDGMFVRDILNDPTDRILVKSIIDIAHTLGCRAIAEFVESAEILEMVAELGADYAQGFHIHRPEVIAPAFPGRLLDISATTGSQ